MTKTEALNILTSRLAKGIFLSVASIFALVAFHPAHDLPHAIRHLGVGMTTFASFIGAYDFATTQGRYVEKWLLGSNLTILILTILFCTLAISKDELVTHNLFVHSSLALYVLWDLLAMNYYSKHSRSGYDSYKIVLKFDLALVAIFFLAYIPIDRFVNPSVAEAMLRTHSEHAFSDLIIGAILIGEFIGFLFYAPKIEPAEALSERLSVADGYATVASYYDDGNPLMYVEGRHTLRRIPTLSTSGTVVDLGCGTGRYLPILLEQANKVYAIDASDEMLQQLRNKHKSPKLEVRHDEADRGLEALTPDSVDAVFSSLLIDHVTGNRLSDIFRRAHKALRNGGWFYITDVNPYYERLVHPYAEFTDPQGRGIKIKVYPHPVSEIKARLESAGFQTWKLTEVIVVSQDADEWEELKPLIGQPLIFEYFAIKS